MHFFNGQNIRLQCSRFVSSGHVFQRAIYNSEKCDCDHEQSAARFLAAEVLEVKRGGREIKQQVQEVVPSGEPLYVKLYSLVYAIHHVVDCD